MPPVRQYHILVASAIPTSLLLILWLCARYIYASNDPSLRTAAFVGWLCATFLLTTVAAVICTAVTSSRSSFSVIYATASLAGLLVALVALPGGYLGWSEILRVYFLLVSWLAFCVILANVFRRWGPGAAVTIPLTLTTLLISSPISWIPLVRATHGSTQDDILRGIGAACPLLALIDAIRPAIKVGWAQLPGMYTFSGLGQDIPMDLPHWYINTAFYAGAALLIFALSRLARRFS
jgi:hypothetical protein